MNTIDLNSDMGESFGLYRHGADDEIISFISSRTSPVDFMPGIRV